MKRSGAADVGARVCVCVEQQQSTSSWSGVIEPARWREISQQSKARAGRAERPARRERPTRAPMSVDVETRELWRPGARSLVN